MYGKKGFIESLADLPITGYIQDYHCKKGYDTSPHVTLLPLKPNLGPATIYDGNIVSNMRDTKAEIREHHPQPKAPCGKLCEPELQRLQLLRSTCERD